MTTTQELLDAAKSALLGTLNRTAQAYQIQGRALTSFRPGELVELIDKLEQKLARETNPIGMPVGYGVREDLT